MESTARRREESARQRREMETARRRGIAEQHEERRRKRAAAARYREELDEQRRQKQEARSKGRQLSNTERDMNIIQAFGVVSDEKDTAFQSTGRLLSPEQIRTRKANLESKLAALDELVARQCRIDKFTLMAWVTLPTCCMLTCVMMFVSTFQSVGETAVENATQDMHHPPATVYAVPQQLRDFG